MKSAFWHFDTWHFSTDSDWGEDDSSGIAIQPDHYPSVAGPKKKHKKRKKKHKTDAICPTCKKNNLVNGSCPQCNWGDNPSDPIDNFPLDPVKDDRAGIRAGSVQTARRLPSDEISAHNPNIKPTDWAVVTRNGTDPQTGQPVVLYAISQPANRSMTEFTSDLEGLLAWAKSQDPDFQNQLSWDFDNE
jgi:hypothetical protein